MIQSFGKQGTADIYSGLATRQARRTLPVVLHEVARRKLDWLDNAASLEDLRVPPGNHLEPLRGDRAGYWSVRINRQYRIVFRWTAGNASDVEIVDYH